MARDKNLEPDGKDSWRIFRIMAEFVEGFEVMSAAGKAVSLFGSARTPESHPDYHACVEFSRLMAEAGWMSITGAGMGIMQAGHVGPGRKSSFGVAIRLPFETTANQVIAGDEKLIQFRYFFTRKLMFLSQAESVALFPGGFGTLDEAYEALTLVQTHKIHRFPIVLFGSEYWRGLLDWVKSTQLAEGMISPEDLNLLIVTDSVDEARDILVDCYNAHCWDTWKKSEGAKLDADPPGAPATAPQPSKGDAE